MKCLDVIGIVDPGAPVGATAEDLFSLPGGLAILSWEVAAMP